MYQGDSATLHEDVQCYRPVVQGEKPPTAREPPDIETPQDSLY